MKTKSLKRILADRDRDLPSDYLAPGQKRNDIAILKTLATFSARACTPFTRLTIVITRLAQDELCRLGIKDCGRCLGDSGFVLARHRRPKPPVAKPSTPPQRSRRR